MTRKFNTEYTCQHCGIRTTAESGFCRWMRNNRALDSGSGIVRSDADHITLRYKSNRDGSRDFQLMMIVEVKEYGAQPDPAQTDILSFLRQLCDHKGLNMHGASTVQSVRAFSKMWKRWISLRWYGVHLLQFEKTNPEDSKWIKWDGHLIGESILTSLLRLDRIPFSPFSTMTDNLRDRHRKDSASEFGFVPLLQPDNDQLRAMEMTL